MAYIIFGIDFGAPMAWLPLWKYWLPIIELVALAVTAYAGGGLNYSNIPSIVAWLFAPAWLLPLHYLQPLLRDIFDESPASKYADLLRRERVVVTWAVEIGLGAIIPMTLVLAAIIYAPRIAEDVSSAEIASDVFQMLAFVAEIMAVFTCLSCVLLTLTLHRAQIELLAYHWKQRTRHPFLEAQPLSGEAFLGERLFLRCPPSRGVFSGAERGRFCLARALTSLYCFSAEWMRARKLRGIAEKAVAPLSSPLPPTMSAKVAPASDTLVAIDRLGAVMGLPDIDSLAVGLDDERAGRPMPLHGATFVEPSIDLIIESFNTTRHSIELTSSTMGLMVACALIVSAIIACTTIYASLYEPPLKGGNTLILICAIVFPGLSSFVTVVAIGINRTWREVEATLVQHVVMYTEIEQLRLMALMARNTLGLTLFGIPANIITGSIWLLLQVILAAALLWLYYYSFPAAY